MWQHWCSAEESCSITNGKQKRHTHDASSAIRFVKLRYFTRYTLIFLNYQSPSSQCFSFSQVHGRVSNSPISVITFHPLCLYSHFSKTPHFSLALQKTARWISFRDHQTPFSHPPVCLIHSHHLMEALLLWTPTSTTLPDFPRLSSGNPHPM